jgi:hypothetical protein
MALWRCLDCTALYAVGLKECPQCQSLSYEEDSVPKISRTGGPSSGTGRQPATGEPVSEPAAPAVPAAAAAGSPPPAGTSTAAPADSGPAQAPVTPETAPEPATPARVPKKTGE